MTTPGTPVVFVHGLWLHADSWGPWVEYFRDAGYQPIAPGWPGDPDTVEEARANPEPLANHGVDEIVAHYTKIIRALHHKPVVIGHSFGGLIAQKLLGQNRASAAVAIDPAPIKGVLALPLSALKVASLALRNPANRKRTIALTPEQFRFGFGNAIPAEESDELHERWTIPGPGRPLFQAATANFVRHAATKVDTGNTTRGPLLLVSGGRDNTTPPAVVKATLKLYGTTAAVTELREFPDRGHSLTIDHGWREIADATLTWLKEHTA